MRLIILGIPGAGKGTQADRISQRLGIPHISTGDIFRQNISQGTELGKIAKEYMDAGKLVPDEITIGIVANRIEQSDCKNGFIFDGFPRTIPQAESLGEKLADMGLKIDTVLDIELADEKVLERMTGRRVCSKCKATYHIKYNPSKMDSICDLCGGSLIQRDDDKEETVAKRIEVYHMQTEPLIRFYKEKNLLKEVEGEGDVESITKKIFEVLTVSV
ncbi:MAG: adenylate kinase [Ignavibacteriales bacterium]